MPMDPDIAEAATFLASHAVLLLFLGLVLVVAAVASVIAAAQLGWRYRSTIASWTTSLRRQIEAFPHVKRLVAQSPRLRPTAYLAIPAGDRACPRRQHRWLLSPRGGGRERGKDR